MSEAGLLRLSGLAAIAGGLLRVLSEFLASVSNPAADLQQFYFLIDFLLLLGVFGTFATDAAKFSWIGAISLATFVFGILLIRSPQVSFLGIHGYQAGASFALLGIAALGVIMLVRRTALLAPLLWLAALASGLSATTGLFAPTATALAGLLFGAGFVATGARALRTN